jgi:hypothetical protein
LPALLVLKKTIDAFVTVADQWWKIACDLVDEDVADVAGRHGVGISRARTDGTREELILNGTSGAYLGQRTPVEDAAKRRAGKSRWVAYPRPHVVIQYYDGLTGDLVYAESVQGAAR